MIYNKLIRDNILEIIKKNWQKAIFHIADEKEYKEKLVLKLQEEVDEFKADFSNEELADILEVINAICDFKWIDFEELEKIKKEKQAKNWWFEKRIILEEVV